MIIYRIISSIIIIDNYNSLLLISFLNSEHRTIGKIYLIGVS